MLPADRVRTAAEKALEAFDPAAHGLDDFHADRRRFWFRGLVGICCAVMIDPEADHVIAVDPNDFAWIMKHYDFEGAETDRRVGMESMEPMKPMRPMEPMRSMEPMRPMEPMKPMAPMRPLDFGPAWWPDNLGDPSTSGGQNNVKYAFFGNKHRLAIKRGDSVTLYDSGDHQISGVSQQQGRTTSLAFFSQHGTVNVDELNRL